MEEKHIKKLTLLHSNDMHGDFLAEKVDDKLVGGISLLSGYVNKVRKEEENVLYAIAGDMVRGSVIDSEFRGLSTIDIMNALGPDVATIGNHEIDYGISHLLFIEKCAQFPIINSNLYIKRLNKRLFKPCEVVKIDGMKILFIGIITEEVMAGAKGDTVGTFISTKEAAEEVGRICNTYNAEDIDLTVLLTHIGFEEDKKLASYLDPVWGVDLIIGGHSHTKLKKPFVVNGIPIVQAFTGTDAIGRFDLYIDTDNNCIDSFTWEFVPINEQTAPRDETIESIITGYKSRTDLKYNRVLTRFDVELTHPERNRETALGNLFADIFADTLGIDLMVLGSGSLRCEKMGPVVTYGDLCASFPYDDEIYMLTVTGAQLRRMMLYMQRDEAFTGGHTEYYQFSKRIRMTYSKSLHEIQKFELDGRPIGDDDLIRIGMQTFHYNNFEDTFNVPVSEIGKNGKIHVISTSCVQILEEYMVANPKLYAEVEGRNLVID